MNTKRRRQPLLTVLLPVIIAALPSRHASAAVPVCQPLPPQVVNNHRALTGLAYLRGPVKSVTMRTESHPVMHSASVLELSPCGQILRYDFMRRYNEAGLQLTTHITGYEDDQAIRLKFVARTTVPGKKSRNRPVITQMDYLKDAQQNVTGYRAESHMEGRDATVSESGSPVYQDGILSRLDINASLLTGSDYRIHWLYDAQGRMTGTQTDVAGMMQTGFTYDSNGVLQSATESVSVTGLTTMNKITCTTWDAHQNCITGIWEKVSRHDRMPRFNDQQRAVFHTVYTYYREGGEK